MVSQRGFEPPTRELKVPYSSTELLRHMFGEPCEIRTHALVRLQLTALTTWLIVHN